MNKKLIISLSIIGVVAAVAIGGTIAYFNDTETSAGNIFTAGSIDLKVDHLKQTYNGVDCETCSVDVYSSIATRVVAASAGAAFPAVPYNAVEVVNPHPAWQNELALAPAQWIWVSDPTAVIDTTNGVQYTFQNKFQWNGSVASVDLDLALASDNGYKIILNGVTIVDKLLTEFNYASAVPLTGPEEAAFIGNMVTNGQNTLEIIVWNKPLAADPVTGNPAGLLFKLNVHRPSQECGADSAFQQACRLWTGKDLGQGDTFFNFNDVKPGDRGTNVISLHVDSNNAYVCMLINHKQNLENGLVDPEIALLDTDATGELSQYLNIVVWEDIDGDGVYDLLPETILYNGGFDGLSTIGKLSLSSNGSDNLGIAWCLGVQTVNGDGSISCDGSGNQNIAQTDKLLADLVLYATQQRNNSDFTCASVQLNP
ncbi:MAG: TasA family protein [Candidatus Nealsonbacteria bacterium]|nr:TasA family protein [Candidatus Nealsonbacteria bacterium]